MGTLPVGFLRAQFVAIPPSDLDTGATQGRDAPAGHTRWGQTPALLAGPRQQPLRLARHVSDLHLLLGNLPRAVYPIFAACTHPIPTLECLNLVGMLFSRCVFTLAWYLTSAYAPNPKKPHTYVPPP